MMNENGLLRFEGNKKILFVTNAYPPTPAAAAVVHKNLLDNFHADVFAIATTKTGFENKMVDNREVRQSMINYSLEHFSGKLHKFSLSFQRKWGLLNLDRIIKREKPAAIVASYPDMHFLEMGYRAAKKHELPFFPFFHDTMAEALFNTPLRLRAKNLQDEVFAYSKEIFVMSDGMADLYKKKYGLKAIPLKHTYNEPIPNTLPTGVPEKMALWGGDVYDINQRGVKRISDFLKNNGYGLMMTTGRSYSDLALLGIRGSHIKRYFFPSRADYIDNLKKMEILILAIDWPDESKMHEDELATIFPTKTIEYLAAGRPIIVHCPEHYFLSKFFKKHDCGILVNTRDPGEINKLISSPLEDLELLQKRVRNGFLTLQQFNGKKIGRMFKNTIDANVG